jgi:hypothetical protein
MACASSLLALTGHRAGTSRVALTGRCLDLTTTEDSAMTTPPARLVPVGLILAAAMTFSLSTVLERQDGTAGQIEQPSEIGARIELESIPLVLGVVVVSLMLALVLLTIVARWAAAVITFAIVIFIALDALTAIHDVAQPGGSPGDILAVLAMVLHVLACFTVVYVVHSSPATGLT